MNTNKYLLASISGFIVMFLLAYLGHDMLMPLISDANPMESIERSEPYMIGIMAAYLVIALIMAYIYPKGVEGDSWIGNGFRFGVLIGILISLPISLIFYSILEGTAISHIFVETIWHAIEQGVGGVVIAYFYRAKS